MKTWLRILIALAGLGIIAGALVYRLFINKPQPDFERENPVYTLTANDLYFKYKNSKTEADSLYTGKIIAVDGTLAKVENADSLVIAVFVLEQGDFGDQGVRCTFLPKYNASVKKLLQGTQVKIKGLCTGFNDTDVVMENCSTMK